MEEQNTTSTRQHTTGGLIFALLTVLLICGGNGMSILVAGLLWKSTGSMPLAIVTVVGLTAIFFALAMVMVALRHREIAAEALAARAAEAAQATPDPEAGN